MPFVKQCSPHLSKSRLKSDLVDHNVELHLRHTEAADFSSDDDDEDDDEQIHVVADDEDLGAAKMPDPSSLTDADLKAMLLKYGFKPGPIVASTRLLYERKLSKLLQSDGCDEAENNVCYSDSEELERHDEEDKESVLEQEIIEASESQQEKMETRRSLSASSDELNSSCVQEQRSPFDRLDLQFKGKNRLEDQSMYCTPKDSCREQGIKVHQQPVADILKDIFPNTQTSPTGIYATPRRPIKGAAQRPVQYPYPDTPVSPLTQERREVERRLVPFQIQIMVFFSLMFILYLIYVHVEHSSPVLALLESLNQRSDG